MLSFAAKHITYLRYFVHIGYHGTKYSGWQKHPDGLSVQKVLETTLNQLLKIPVTIVGCGRTDAHVHASQFFFHMDLVQGWDFDLFFRLNKILPPDIAVFDIIPMQGLCHARFDAVQRTYDYFIHTYKDPFLGDYSALYAGCNFDLDKMKLAIALLPQYKDYRAFCKSPDRNDYTLCNVMAAELFADATGDRLRFRITANRFLSKMVRSITGRLLEVGKGAISVDEFESYLIHTETPRIIIPAYPQGLYLSKVTYPYLDIPARAGFSALLQNTTADTWQVV